MGKRGAYLAIASALAAWIAGYSYALGACSTPTGMAVTGAFTSFVIGHATLVKTERRRGVAYTITYIAFLVLTTVALTKSIQPSVQWSSEFLVFSVLSSVFAAAYNALVRGSDREFIPQLFFLYALLTPLYGFNAWVFVALTALAAALVCSPKSLVGLMTALIFLTLPFAGLPAVTYNIESLPHFRVPGVAIASPQYVMAVIMTYVGVAVAGGISGLLAMAIWRSLSTPTGAGRALLNSLLTLIPPAIFVAIVAGITSFRVPWLTGQVAEKAFATALSTSFAASIIINSAILRRSAVTIVREVKDVIDELSDHLASIRDAVNALANVAPDSEGVSKLLAKVGNLESTVAKVRESVNRGASYDTLRTLESELRTIKDSVESLDSSVVNAFKEYVSALQNARPIVSTYVNVPDILWRKILAVANVDSAYDVGIKAESLRSVASELCSHVRRAIEKSVRWLNELTAASINPNEILRPCSGRGVNPLTSVKDMIRLYSEEVTLRKHLIRSMYAKLLKLKEVIKRLRDTVEREGLNRFRTGELILKLCAVLSEVPDVMPSTHVSIKLIKETLDRLRETISKAGDTVEEDLKMLESGELRGVNPNVLASLSSLGNLKEKMEYIIGSIGGIARASEYGDFLDECLATLPKALNRVIEVLREMTRVRKYAGIIPLVFEYVDYLLSHGRGEVRVSDLPFKHDIALGYLQLYALSREDVEPMEMGVRLKSRVMEVSSGGSK